jgi:hypothetical protein
MKAFLLLVTWLASNQPPSHYQVQFSSSETCEAARQQLIKDAERIGQAMIERATAQDRQIGGGNKTLKTGSTIRRCRQRVRPQGRSTASLGPSDSLGWANRSPGKLPRHHARRSSAGGCRNDL